MAIASGEYVQANNLPVGLEIWRNKLFITVPRWKAGVASTLNYVLLGSGNLKFGILNSDNNFHDFITYLGFKI